jgi:hypothetical protein
VAPLARFGARELSLEKDDLGLTGIAEFGR